MTIRDLLVRAYPRSWRSEYGEELAALLAQTKLSPAVAADVLSNAARQRVRREEPWKICGATLAVWYLTTRVAVLAFHEKNFILWYWGGGLLIVLAAGAWTVGRNDAGIWQATLDSAKAAAIGQLGALALALRAVSMMGATPYQGHTTFYWFAQTVALNLAVSVLLGLMGASAARGVRFIRSHIPQAH